MIKARSISLNAPFDIPTSLLAAGGIVGGYSVSRLTGIRPLGGAVLAVVGVVAARQWRDTVSEPVALALSAAYTGAFALSHPLAKKIGAWPAVLGLAGAMGVVSYVVADRAEHSALRSSHRGAGARNPQARRGMHAETRSPQAK
ncbi:hypothetical protein QFZ74_002359 [Streptomyces sp. V3I7]|nr:hypothetical protein [Streptomyces sp. V3I7]